MKWKMLVLLLIVGCAVENSEKVVVDTDSIAEVTAARINSSEEVAVATEPQSFVGDHPSVEEVLSWEPLDSYRAVVMGLHAATGEVIGPSYVVYKKGDFFRKDFKGGGETEIRNYGFGDQGFSCIKDEGWVCSRLPVCNGVVPSSGEEVSRNLFSLIASSNTSNTRFIGYSGSQDIAGSKSFCYRYEYSGGSGLYTDVFDFCIHENGFLVTKREGFVIGEISYEVDDDVFELPPHKLNDDGVNCGAA